MPTGTTATLTIDALVAGSNVTFASPATITGPATPFAILSETCSGATVSDGATCSFEVTYTPPPAGGPASSSFTVGNNADGSPQTINLAGNGIPPGEVAFTNASFGILVGAELDFGDVGNVSSTLTLEVSGMLGSTVIFDAVTVTGGRFDENGGGSCEGAMIAAGGTCTVVIDFNGSGGGNNPPIWTGTLTVLHDGTGSSSTLSLTGQ